MRRRRVCVKGTLFLVSMVSRRPAGHTSLLWTLWRWPAVESPLKSPGRCASDAAVLLRCKHIAFLRTDRSTRNDYKRNIKRARKLI